MSTKQKQNYEFQTGFPLDASFQGDRRLFVLAFNNTTVNVPNNNTNSRVLRKSHTKYFLPRVNITNYNVLIDGRNFYDQPINDLVKHYDEIRKTATGQGEDYITGCLLDYQYFNDHYNLIANRKNQMLIQEQFKKLSFMGYQKLTHKCVQFQKNQKRRCQNFTKEQQKFCE